jgi:crossover junction endodeoxyribonuclease RuvC
MIYIGIDPGKTGGIAIISECGVDAITPMIIAGKDIDLAATAEWIDYHVDEDHAICYIEKVSAMPKQGVTSMFNFGFSTGAMHGIVATLGMPRYMVTAHQWKIKVLAGLDWKGNKGAAIDFCRRAYPDISLLATEKSRKPHSGMADALCIARYGLITEERYEL